MRNFVFIAATVTIALSIAAPAGAATPSFQGLGYFAGQLEGNDSYGYGISADGLVVIGTSRLNGHGTTFRWTTDGGKEDLGLLPGAIFSRPTAVSADGGVIMGWGYDAGAHTYTYRWTADGGMEDRPDISGLADISADGTIFALTRDNVGSFEAHRWTADQGAVALGFLPGHDISSASGISADGSAIAGTSMVKYGVDNQAFRWTSQTGMVGLGTLPGTIRSMASGISDDGSVVIGSCGESSSVELFRWTEAGGMVGLGNIFGEGYYRAEDSSADGSIIVGSYKDGNQTLSKPFLFPADDGMQDLQVILAGLGIDLSGWALDEAVGISADGTKIVGTGTNPQGINEAFIATIPEPTSLAILTLGGLGLLRGRRRFGA